MPGAGCGRRRHAGRLGGVGAALGAVLLTAILAPVAWAGPTAASNPASLTASVVQLSAALHRSAAALAADRNRVQHLQASLTQQRAELASLQDQLSATRLQLRRAALQAYVTGAGSAGSFGPITALLASSELEAAARSEYQGLVDGDLATALARWRASQAAVRAQAARLHTLLADAQQVQAQTAAQQQQLASELTREETLLAQVQAAEQAAATSAASAAGQPRGGSSGASRPHTGSPTGQGAPLTVTAQLVTPPSLSTTPSATPPSPSPTPSSSTTSTGAGTSSDQAGGSAVPQSLAQDLAQLRECESGDDYTANTGNGYYGAYQFSLQTWQSLGYSGLPSSAPPAEQDQAAATLAETVGWDQWPVCSALLGLSGRASPSGG